MIVGFAIGNGTGNKPLLLRGMGPSLALFGLTGVLADPVATAEVGQEKFEVRARVAEPDERAELARRIEYLEPQQARTEREIPIVVLEKT